MSHQRGYMPLVLTLSLPMQANHGLERSTTRGDLSSFKLEIITIAKCR